MSIYDHLMAGKYRVRGHDIDYAHNKFLDNLEKRGMTEPEAERIWNTEEKLNRKLDLRKVHTTYHKRYVPKKIYEEKLLNDWIAFKNANPWSGKGSYKNYMKKLGEKYRYLKAHFKLPRQPTGQTGQKPTIYQLLKHHPPPRPPPRIPEEQFEVYPIPKHESYEEYFDIEDPYALTIH